jgi:DNA recombination protein RmuC
MDFRIDDAFAVVAILIAVYFWVRATTAKAAKVQLEQRVQEMTGELVLARADLARSQADVAMKAAFEPLAAERERALRELAAEREGLRANLLAKAETERQQTGRISQIETELKNERENLAEKLALLDSAKQALANQFEALAGEILEKKSKIFSEGSQKELGTLLTPLREQIKEFREKVEKAQADSSTGVTKLETLIGTLGGLNQQLSEEARNLTTALRGSSKAQGDWGEFILRDLLEKAGLHEGEQYSFQQTFSGVESEDGDESKSPRTDVIVFLPGKRHLIIDSKVSLNAYTDYVNGETEEQRGLALREHLKSVRNHVAGLESAGYLGLPGIEPPDFVIMFVPIEPAFLIALQNEPELWSEAYRKGILLVGPTTLLYVIRIVSVLWDSDTQARNVKDVIAKGETLYEKFVGFVSDLEQVGKGLNGATQAYEEATKKLTQGRGNLIKQAEELRKLGVKRKRHVGSKKKPQKSIPLKWLASAGVEDSGEEGETLSLAAEAEGDSPAGEPTESTE